MPTNTYNIQDIGNLVFFTEKGYEIPTEKTYTIQWEIIPCSQATNHFIVNPAGHFMYDITDETKTILIVVDEPGKLTDTPLNLTSSPDYQGQILSKSFSAQEKVLASSVSITDDGELYNAFTYKKSLYHYRDRNTGDLKTETEEVSERIGNTVRITINTLTETIVNEYPIEYIFSDVSIEPQVSVDINENTSFTYLKVTKLTFTKINGSTETNTTLINELIENNFSYNELFPCVKYIGTVKQDKVSTDFIAASTFIILNSNFETPYVGSYKLSFEFQKDSEMRFISSDTIANIIWNSTCEPTITQGSPIYFSVGFETQLEGCYQNIMAMYVKQETEKYLIGLFTFLTEVEGEDERYRALLGNLGIPDPIKYPNIFRSQDPQEQGIDWTLINNKSKELMISYDNIFPYVGTYKALLGAVKFLGYQDLIFKEWYKIKDSYGRDKYVTLQAYDLVEGKSLKSKLKKVGVDFGEFERYRKLNRLSMIYHLNEIDDETGEYITFYTKRKYTDTDTDNVTTSPENGLYKSSYVDTHRAEFNNEFTQKTLQFMQLPFTYKLFEYRTDEILAKLFAVKRWLEKYILGVNCYISDICGEFIVVERFKNQAYVTQHNLKDIQTSGCFTPKIINHTEFEKSQSTVTCSLNEFDSITFENYEDFPIESFIKEEWTPTGGSEPIYISAPLETLVTASEYQFKLTNNSPSSGTLYEFTHEDFITNPILIQDNEFLFFDDTQNITKIDTKELPIIEIAQGNLRYCHGSWKNNIAYSINVVTEPKTGNEFYTMYDEVNDDELYKGIQKVFLYPYIKNNNIDTYKLYWYYGIESDLPMKPVFDGKESEMIYTSHTKWNVPMLIIRNYKCGNNNEIIDGDYILEIIKGRILFRNHKTEINKGTAEGCEIIFGQEFEGREQPIDINYLYVSDREPIYTFNKTGITDSYTEDQITANVSTHRYVDISVNRIGAYTVQVEAFDMYNNIYVNNSDDTTVINAKPIEIDTILNQEFVSNDYDFHCKSYYGNKLLSKEVDDISTQIYIDSSKPIYPQTYRIYDIDPLLDEPGFIEYDNISYAIDTPKPGDFLVFNNFTERVLNIEKQDNNYKLKLLDENPNTDTIKYATHVGLCIYDSLQKDILADIYPLTVEDKEHITEDASLKLYDVNNSYIILSKDSTTIEDTNNNEFTLDNLVQICKDTSLLDSSSHFINSINAYIYSANETILDVDDISVDIDKRLSYITDNEQHYVESQVVKICFTNDDKIHNRYTQNTIDNETAYRIINVSNNADNTVVYTLDGIIDLQRLNNKLYHNKASVITSNSKLCELDVKDEYKIKLCPVHLRAAQYTLRVNGYGEEIVQKYNGGNVMRTRVEYCPTPLLFDNYLDTIYSAQLYDYDPKLLQNIWDIPYIQYDKNPLYLYRNKPVTVNKGQTVIMRPNPEQLSLDTNIALKVNWDWKSFLIDDQSNWHSNLDLIGKQLVFRSVNKTLCIKPELLGSQTTQMTCCDIYGNRIINEGEGFIYVNNNTYIVNDKEQGTRDIEYRDVFLVASEFIPTPAYTVPTNGGGNTFTTDNTDVQSAVRADKSPVTYTYKLYYSDGTVLENEGADVVLLTSTGRESKTNKVKLTFNKAKHAHKHIAGNLRAKMKILKTHELDLVQNEQIFNIPVYQYGYSITTSIYNLSFNVKPIPREGLELINKSTINYYITDIHYTLTRSEGEIEDVYADNLYDAHLQITQVKFIHNKFGLIDYIPENLDEQGDIGLLQLTVRFYINGVQGMITTRSISKVTQL